LAIVIFLLKNDDLIKNQEIRFLFFKMTKKLFIDLFTTFIISTIISIAVICVFYSISQKTNDYAHVVQLVSSGAFLLNLILLIMSLPVLFLSFPEVRDNVSMRLLLNFSGPLVFIITAFFIQLNKYDRIVYLLTGLIFTVIRIFFYYKTIKRLS